MSESASAQKRVYHISPRRRGILLGVWLLFVAPLSVAAWYSRDLALVWVLLLLGTIMGVIFGLSGWWYPRLVLHPGGVRLHHIGWTLDVEWDNVSGLRPNRGSEGLILRRPLSGSGAGRLAASGKVAVGGVPFYGPEQRQLIAERRFVPLEPFAYWFKHGDLQREITRNAPWLPDELNRPPVDEIPTPGRQPATGDIVKVVAIVVFAVAAGVSGEIGPPNARVFIQGCLGLALGVVMALYAFSNFKSSLRCFKEKRFGQGVLWMGMSIAQILLVLAILGWFMDRG
jgi:hypothetical protein